MTLTRAVKPATGRRKEAVARVRLIPGSGQHTVNGRALREYFPRESHQRAAVEPLAVAQREGQFDVLAVVRGGGLTGQAGAVRMGVARALVRDDESLRPAMRRHGFLTRDSRMVERKKYGQAKARKRFQFSKR
jgi:small subunit ribosomal protein S9